MAKAFISKSLQQLWKQFLCKLYFSVYRIKSKCYCMPYKEGQPQTEGCQLIQVRVLTFLPWPADMGLPLEFQSFWLNLLSLTYPLNLTGANTEIYMASVYMLSLTCCHLFYSLCKKIKCSNGTETLHVTVSTTKNCQVLIYSCTHTITKANIQHSSIMKP